MVDGINFDQSLLNRAARKELQAAGNDVEKQKAVFEKARDDGKLTGNEKDALTKGGFMTNDQIKLIKDMPDGEKFLSELAYAHLDGNMGQLDANQVDIVKGQREDAIIDFLLKATGNDIEAFANKQKELNFDLPADKVHNKLVKNLQREAGRVDATIVPDASLGQTTATKLQVKVEKDGENIKSIALYEGNAAKAGSGEPTRTLVPSEDGKYFVDQQNGKYYTFNAEKNSFADVTKKVEEFNDKKERIGTLVGGLADDVVIPENYAQMTQDEKIEFLEQKQIEGLQNKLKQLGGADIELEGMFEDQKAQLNRAIEKQTTFNTNKAAFTPAEGKNKIAVTIDEGDSGQRLHVKKDGGTQTRLHIYKDSTTDAETGLPTHVAISLGKDYGIQPKEGGKPREMWQDLFLDKETGLYTDRAKMRKFEAVVSEDGKVTFKEQIDDKTKHDTDIKKFVGDNKVAAEKMIDEFGAQIKEATGQEHNRTDVDATPWFEQKGQLQTELRDGLKAQSTELGIEVNAEELDKKPIEEQIKTLQDGVNAKQTETINGLTEKVKEYVPAGLSEDQQAQLNAEPSMREKVKIAENFVVAAQDHKIEDLKTEVAGYAGVEVGGDVADAEGATFAERKEARDLRINDLIIKVDQAEANNAAYAENKNAIEQQWNILTEATNVGLYQSTPVLPNPSYTEDGKLKIELENRNAIYVGFDNEGNIDFVNTALLPSDRNGLVDFAVDSNEVTYIPETYTDSNDTSVTLVRTGDVYNKYKLEDAINVVNTLAQQAGFEVKPKPEPLIPGQ